MERHNILYCMLVSNQQKASEFPTKAMQQCTNIYNSCFEVMHMLNVFSVDIMSNVSGIWGGYEKTLNLLKLSESDTKRLVDTDWRERKPVNRALQWHLSSPAHCERLWASAVNKFNDAHWKRDVWAAAVTIWWLRAPLAPMKLHRLSN